MIRVAVIGAAGYTGGELVRLITKHKELELSMITGHSNAGKHILEVFPYLRGYADCMIETLDVDKIAETSDVAFIALPHGHAVEISTKLVEKNVVVIDLGADFRFDDPNVYEEWYKVEHKNHELNNKAVYGLPEIWRDKIKDAKIIANPGCFPTSATLGLYPVMLNHLVDPKSIIVDSKSGISGAGRTPGLKVVYSECNESIAAYNIGKHRHIPEIEQNLANISGEDVLINFTPHLTPMTRGILSTIYCNLNEEAKNIDIQKLYEETYKDEFFIRVLPEGAFPATKWVSGSNFCDISVTVDERTNRLVICAAIDNLFRGASGQAMQNLNIIFGFDEQEGIDNCPIFP